MREEAQSLSQRDSLLKCISVQQCPSSHCREQVSKDINSQRQTRPRSLVLAAKRANRRIPSHPFPPMMTALWVDNNRLCTSWATPPNNASGDPTIWDTDSDLSFYVPNDSGAAIAKSNSQTKNINDPREWPKDMNGSLRDILVHAGQYQNKVGNFPRDETNIFGGPLQ